jgi:hypothetical protein
VGDDLIEGAKGMMRELGGGQCGKKKKGEGMVVVDQAKIMPAGWLFVYM